MWIFLTLGLIFATPENRELKVLFLGDSITAGYGLSVRDAYPQKVQELLAAQDIRIQAINGGVSGDTTAGGLRRLSWQLKSNPDWVVIALGGNDMLRGLPPETTKQNLIEMIRRIKEKNIRVALLGMKANPTMGRDFVSRFDSIYPDLGKTFKIPVLDFFISDVALKSEFNLEDRIHPNSRGQLMIAEKVSQFLAPWFRKKLEN
jgi:acyl-CoA thioesterase-1